MDIKLLLFDFDGTIADTFHFIMDLSNRWAREYKYKEVFPHEIEDMKNKNTREVIQHLGVPIMKIPMIVARAKEALQSEITRIQPIPGLKEVLVQLRQHGFRMDILTSNSHENVVKFLQYHRMNYFNLITSTSKIWSKDASIKAILKKENLSPPEVIYIGDETRDIVAAKRAHVRVAAVTWGYNSELALRENDPDFIFRAPAELLQLTQNIPSA